MCHRVLGHIRSQRTTKLQIFTCRPHFAPTVGAIHGEDTVRSRFWSSDGPPFHHLRHGGLERYDSLWLAGVSHASTCWDVGSSCLRATLDPPFQEFGLHRRLVWRTPPPRGDARPGIHWRRSALHRPRTTRRPQHRDTHALPRAHARLKPHSE